MKYRALLVNSLLVLTILGAIPPSFGTYQVSDVMGVLVVSPSQEPGSPGSRNFTIIVGHDGFNHSSGPLTLHVNQGENLTIKFIYGDANFTFDNPHIIMIEGYNAQTHLLDKKAPVQVLSIIVGQTGRFVIYCIIPCFGMENMQTGVLEVVPGPVRVAINTILAMHHMEYHRGPHFHEKSVVTDKNGDPVSGVLVDLFVYTSFGLMMLGSNITQADGTVDFLYPLTTTRDMSVFVSFGGSGHLRPSNATGMLLGNYTTVNRNEATTPYLFGQTRLIDLRLAGIPPLPAYVVVIVAMTVLAAVWSVFAYVLTQILAIRRIGKKQEVTE